LARLRATQCQIAAVLPQDLKISLDTQAFWSGLAVPLPR